MYGRGVYNVSTGTRGWLWHTLVESILQGPCFGLEFMNFLSEPSCFSALIEYTTTGGAMLHHIHVTTVVKVLFERHINMLYNIVLIGLLLVLTDVFFGRSKETRYEMKMKILRTS